MYAKHVDAKVSTENLDAGAMFNRQQLDLAYQNRSIGPNWTPGSVSQVQTGHSTDPNLHFSPATTAPTNSRPRTIAITTMNFCIHQVSAQS
jgi:hypothetical protein